MIINVLVIVFTIAGIKAILFSKNGQIIVKLSKISEQLTKKRKSD